MMVMSMEGRAFGAYPQRTFVDAPRMGVTGIALIVVTLAAVIVWYTSLAMGVVHSVYVFAPN
jgi:energy-coupling factor transport system permease protein